MNKLVIRYLTTYTHKICTVRALLLWLESLTIPISMARIHNLGYPKDYNMKRVPECM